METQYLKDHIKKKMIEMNNNINQAKFYGKEQEVVAWSHSYLAYKDILDTIDLNINNPVNNK